MTWSPHHAEAEDALQEAQLRAWRSTLQAGQEPPRRCCVEAAEIAGAPRSLDR